MPEFREVEIKIIENHPAFGDVVGVAVSTFLVGLLVGGVAAAVWWVTGWDLLAEARGSPSQGADYAVASGALGLLLSGLITPFAFVRYLVRRARFARWTVQRLELRRAIRELDLRIFSKPVGKHEFHPAADASE